MTDDSGPTQHDSHFQRWLALVNLSPEERTERLFDMWWRSVSDRSAKSLKREDADIDVATPERLKLAGKDGFEEFVTETGARTKRMLDGSVLDNLASRKAITGDQYAAGAQLYQDWYLAGFASSGVIDPSKDIVDGGVIAGANDRLLDAAGRFAKALIAVGKVHSHPLINIILIEQPLNEYGLKRFAIKDEKDARLKAITALQLALEQLDYHYYGQRKTKGGSSHVADYRPSIQEAT